MHLLLNLLRSHGPWALFTAAFLESVGIPLPAGIFLILSGCLVIEGTVSLPGALAAAVAGALAGDLHWFMIGRLKGRGALRVLCRLSLNPDACMGRTENLFRSRTVLSILTAKLVPGLNTVIAPLAGILGLPWWRYALLDLAGCSLWAGVGVGLGLVFGSRILPGVLSFQRGLTLILLILTSAYVIWRASYRRYLIRRYSVPRLDSADVLARIASDAAVIIVDLRNEDAYYRSEVTLPGALRIPPAELDRHLHLLPIEREIILYCT